MFLESEKGLSPEELSDAVEAILEARRPKKLLLLPPDYTRLYSGAGKLTAMILRNMRGRAEVHVMPALGTHAPMTDAECAAFFEGEIDHADLIVHDWRHDVEMIGSVPRDFVREASEGLVDEEIPVEINRRLLDPSYDLILSIGQVVPHEVVGMANYSKNVFVGCGGSRMINSSHMLGAFYGLERVMGRDFSPVRNVFDYAEEHFLSSLPLSYLLTVTTSRGDATLIHGLYAGRERANFERAVKLSQKLNLTHVSKPFSRAVVYLDPREFKSTWLGNKAIYRTRMAMRDGGELLILAPGVAKFGEDAENDRLIRKYGYVGRERILALVKENAELRENLSAAAHLIHGSSDGRFSVTYAVENMTREEIEGVGYRYLPYAEAVKEYDPARLSDGWHETSGGERFFYISNPALGLWTGE